MPAASIPLTISASGLRTASAVRFFEKGPFSARRGDVHGPCQGRFEEFVGQVGQGPARDQGLEGRNGPLPTPKSQQEEWGGSRLATPCAAEYADPPRASPTDDPHFPILPLRGPALRHRLARPPFGNRLHAGNMKALPPMVKAT